MVIVAVVEVLVPPAGVPADVCNCQKTSCSKSGRNSICLGSPGTSCDSGVEKPTAKQFAWLVYHFFTRKELPSVISYFSVERVNVVIKSTLPLQHSSYMCVIMRW